MAGDSYSEHSAAADPRTGDWNGAAAARFDHDRLDCRGASADRHGVPNLFRDRCLIHFILAPATVALAISLYKNIGEIRRSTLAIGAAVAAGAITASGSAMAIAWNLGVSPTVIRSIAPKSVTTPIAIGVSAQIGGHPELTAVLVVATGAGGALRT